MSATTDIEATRTAVPALASTPSVEIDRDDIILPRLKIGQPQSPQVMEEQAKQGSIFYTSGEDAEVVHDPSGSAALKKPLVVHVLSMYKRKSLSADGELETWAFNDPSAPPEAWVTYNYGVYLPNVEDNSLPFKWLLTRTAAPAAKQINLAILKHGGPAHELAFGVTTKRREKTNGSQKYIWYVPVISVVEAKLEDVETAANLASLVANQPEPAPRQQADEPEI